MAYDSQPSGGAAKMATSDDGNLTELDPSKCGGREYKAGDKITFTVVGHTSDGMMKVKCDEPSGMDAFDADFDKNMAEHPSEMQQSTDGGGAEEST